MTTDGKQWAVCDEKGIKILAADLTATELKPEAAVKLELLKGITDALPRQWEKRVEDPRPIRSGRPRLRLPHRPDHSVGEGSGRRR